MLGNPRSFVSRVTLDRARAIPREMSSTAPLAIVRGTARELFLRHPRGGRLYAAASRLHHKQLASGGDASAASEPAAANGALARTDWVKRRAAVRMAIVYNCRERCARLFVVVTSGYSNSEPLRALWARF